MGNQTVDGLTSCGEKKNLWKSMGSINSLVTDILLNILFCVQTRLEQLGRENDTEFSFLGPFHYFF